MPPLALTARFMLVLCGGGTIQSIIEAQIRLVAGSASHPADQRPWLSLVQATARPSPYCHCARIGSPFGLASTVVESGLGVVTT